MASPLTLFLPIKQDTTTQQAAVISVQNFNGNVKDLLDSTEIVHYATLVLVPNQNNDSGAQAIMLLTDFDLAMTPYLKTFWDVPGIRDAILGLQQLALDPGLPIETFTQFENFVVKYNLTPQVAPQWANFYQAYNKTVKQILNS